MKRSDDFESANRFWKGRCIASCGVTVQSLPLRDMPPPKGEGQSQEGEASLESESETEIDEISICYGLVA